MNKTLLAVAGKIPVFFFASILTTTAAAQGVNSGAGSVLESQPFTPGQSAQSSAVSAGPSNDAMSLLLEQNQQLRAELQALRALLEEQGFEIRKLQRDTLSRYTNTDERLSTLESGAQRTIAPVIGGETNTTPAAPASSTPSTSLVDSSPASRRNGDPGTEVATTSGPARSSSRPSRGTLQPAVLSEQQLYQMAYESAINSNFKQSIAEFDQYLSIYPQGRFVTNAYYWKGQAYLYLNQYADARDSYEIILNNFEESAKLPDAMYGLGLAYEGLGNIAQARQLLNEINHRFPNTGAANLADIRLRSLD